MNKFEVRMNPTSISTNEEGKMYCEGLVNGTETWSKEMGVHRKFIEKIRKGAFTRALEKAPRIDFLAEHDNTKLLATTENGSLELFEDSEGLKMRAEIVPTTYGKDMYELMKSGMVRNMSFGFKSLKDKWEKRTNGLYERTIEELALAEVSVVRNPAYATSGISARGIELVEDVEIPSDVEEIKEEVMEEVQEVVEQEATETVEEVTKEEVVETVEVEVEEVVEEATKEDEVTESVEEEKRAHFIPIYSKSEAVNRCLDIIAQTTELMAYANETEVGNAVVPTLNSTIKAVSEYMISLTEVEQKAETVGEKVADIVENIVDSLVEDVRSIEEEPTKEVEVVEATNEDEKVVEPETVEETVEEVNTDKEEVEVDVQEEKVEENEDTSNTEKAEVEQTIDLSKYRQLIKEDKVI